MNQVEDLDEAWVRSHALPQPGDGGKEERGRVLVVGAGIDMVGALVLAGTAALRAGAGKLQLAAPEAAAVALSLATPEARIVALPVGPTGRPTAAAADILGANIERCDALLIGPGMMDDQDGLAQAVLKVAAGRPTVVDAGALSAIVELPPADNRILTPHAGEMAGLLGWEQAEVEADPLAAAREAVERLGGVAVMKGARTYIVSPGRPAVRYAGGGPGLGVSGSGDVLAGLISGLLARGAAPFDAAAIGVLLHGHAGERLSRSVGPLGFLAREISDEAPALLASFQ